MPITIMNQVQTRLRREETTTRAINNLESKVGKLEVAMENMALQIELQNLMLKQLFGSVTTYQTLDANKKGENVVSTLRIGSSTNEEVSSNAAIVSISNPLTSQIC